MQGDGQMGTEGADSAAFSAQRSDIFLMAEVDVVHAAAGGNTPDSTWRRAPGRQPD